MLISSIIRRHNHVNALTFMGVNVENMSFPAVTGCPFCGETTLYVYDNTAREDIWLICDNCSAHGNIITFAAQIWKLDVPGAIDQFRTAGLCTRQNDAIELTQIVGNLDIQKKAEDFWATAASQLWTHEDDVLSHKFREFGISREIECGGLIGVAHPEQIAEFCASIRRAVPRPILAKRLVVVFPYYDFPGRHTGFLLHQYSEEIETRRGFISMAKLRTVKPDAGYYLVDTAKLPPNPAVGNSHFVVDDPIWALKAQTTQLRHGDRLLPISASYVGNEAISYGVSWRSFAHTRRFFYGATVTPELISQVAACRGYVCPAAPEVMEQPPMPVRTIKRLAAICKSAVTWQTALENVFKQMNAIAATGFAARLNISREKLQQFFKDRTNVPPESVARILERISTHHGVAPERNKSMEVIERDAGWFTTAGIHIVNCIPVIKRIIYADDDQKYYEGFIRKQDKEYPFCERADRVDRLGLLGFAEQLLAPHGELVLITGKWNNRAMQVALRLRPPEVITISSKPGWNDKTREFQFSRYSLTNDGVIVPSPAPKLQENPTFDFPEPSTSAPLTIRNLLTASHENAFIWSLTAAVLADLIAPILDVAASSVAIRSDAFVESIKCGAFLGCAHTEVGGLHQANPNALTRAIQIITHPGFISAPHEIDRFLLRGIVRYPKSPALVKLSAASLPAALSYDWTALAPIAVPAAHTDYSPLRFIVPAYIQRVLRNRAGLSTTNSALITAILRDMHIWLDSTYNASFNLPAAEKITLTPDKAHSALMVELNKAIIAEKIAILPRARYKTQDENYFIRDKETWWLNRKVIDAYFLAAGIVPNWNALLNCFTKDGIFRGEKAVHNMPGVLVERDWCDSFWSDYTDSKSDVKDVG